VATKKQAAALKGHTAAVHTVAFAPDGTHLASADRDGSVLLWELTNPAVSEDRGHRSSVQQGNGDLRGK